MLSKLRSNFMGMIDAFEMPSFSKENAFGIVMEALDNSISVYCDMPGIKQDDISIEMTDDIVNISGTRKTANTSTTIRKSFNVPAGYNKDSVTSSLEDGVLTFSFTKAELKPVETKKIVLENPIK